jgi:integrase/recombinase XerD
LAAVRDLRVARPPVMPEDLEALETDVLAGFVLARAAARLSDGTIASDVVHLEQVRAWFGRPLWEMEPADADVYFGKVLRDSSQLYLGGMDLIAIQATRGLRNIRTKTGAKDQSALVGG